MVRKISSVGLIIAVVTSILMLIIWSILHFGFGMVSDEATNTPAFWASADSSKESWDSDNDPNFLVDVFVTAVTILVVAIPEGLPLAVTLALTYSSKQMIKEDLKVKRIDSAETMGSATTICTDKTGTLTKNIMVGVAFVGGGTDSYALRPEKLDAPTKEDRQKIMKTVLKDEGYSDAFMQLLCESILINSDDKSTIEDTNTMNYHYEGNPTDCATIGMCYEMGYKAEEIRKADRFKEADPNLKIGRNHGGFLPFSSELKCMMWAVPHEDGIRVFVKGAGEKVLERCTTYLDQDGHTIRELDGSAGGALEDMVEEFQNKAFRVISTGFKDFPDKNALESFAVDQGPFQLGDLYKEFTLIGIIGIQDPLKDTVKHAIAQCFKAGVDVRMITGDNKRTAVAIATNAGILREEHFKHEPKEHPSARNRDLFSKQSKYFEMLTKHKTMDEIRKAMKKDGCDANERDAFIAGCEKCRGEYVDGVFNKDPLVALRANFALEGKEFAEKVHSNLHQIEHYTSMGQADNLSYGDEVVPSVVHINESGTEVLSSEMAKSDGTKEDDEPSKLPKGVSQEALDEIWPKLRVMARCHPMDKQTLVSGLMESEMFKKKDKLARLLTEENIWIFSDHQVVAVTGDGTNDAPALKKANVGFAMGIAGTKVAQSACDIIVMDDNFSSVVTSLKWGRNVYDSVAKFLQFQLTVNIVAVIVASLGAIIYQKSPLGAVQMLWVNLVMDSLGSLALATEKPNDSLLDRKPYGRKMSMISRPMSFNIIGQSVYQLFVVLFIMFYGEIFLYSSGLRGENQQNALDGSSELVSGRAAGCDATQHYSVLFNAFVMMTLCNQISSRKLNNEMNLFAGITENRIFIVIMFIELIAQACFVQFLGNFAECYDEGLTWKQWIWCLGFGVGVWPCQILINLVVSWTTGDPDEEEEKRIFDDIRTAGQEEEAKPTTLLDKMADGVSSTRLGAHRLLVTSTNDLTKKHAQHVDEQIRQSANDIRQSYRNQH